MPIEPGTRLGPYEIVEPIGKGGMGEVFRARDTKLDRDVAIKVLPDSMASDGEYLRRFEQEARAASALSHPNIVTIYQVGEHGSTRYIAMEYVAGRTLREILDEGPVEHELFHSYATQLVEGVAKAHGASIVHRDLKPDNVVVGDDGYLKILDFGLAKLSSAGAVGSEIATAVVDTTTPGTILGTMGYMSPEQARGEPADHRSDQFSLGAILYELATGTRAFDAETAAERLAAVLTHEPALESLDLALATVMEKCLQKASNERWETTDALLIALGDALEPKLSDDRPPSVAVLPFDNMSGDPEQSYFSDGITEDIITDLSKVSSLMVVARNSSFTYKGRAVKAQDICADLGVRHVVEGSVRKSGNKVRITAQLIDGSTGGHVWADRYDGTLDDIFALQDEVTCQIVAALKVRLLPEERDAIELVPTASIEAYEHYLRGRQHFNSFSKEDLRHAMNCFHRAIESDERYARAYCGLADCGSFLNVFHGGDSASLVDATVAATKAIELAPDSAEAHASLGLVLSTAGDFPGAETQFSAAIRLDPNLYEAHYYRARSFFAEGKLQEAAESFETAWERSPKEPQTPSLLLQTYRSLGRQADLERAARATVKLGLEKLEAEPDNWRTRLSMAFGYAHLGQFDEARATAEPAARNNPDDSQVNYNIACLYSRMGELDTALDHLEASLRHKVGLHFKQWVDNDSDMDPLRDHPRFKELLKKAQS